MNTAYTVLKFADDTKVYGKAASPAVQALYDCK